MTLLDAVRALRRNALTLVICTLLGVAAALAWTFTRPTIFRAQAIGIVVTADQQSVVNSATGQNFAQTRAQEYVSLIGTKAVATNVAKDMAEQKLTPGGYSAVAAGGGSAFIRVTGTGPNGQVAQATAEAALRALIFEALRVETYARTKGEPRSQEQMMQLTSVHVLPYEPATAPTSPDRPNLVRNVGLGALAGLLIGIAIAVARSQLDTRVRTKQDIETATGHAVLGVVPSDKTLARKAGLSPLSGHVGEAMRKLRTNLRYVHVDDPIRSLVVTSANPGEGKSTMASNLARLLALSGQPVILIDCDLRRPMQGTIFAADTSVGLAQVLSGDTELKQALQATDVPNLQLLTAGRVPPNPSELAGSRKMRDLIQSLTADSMVVIDSPPMLAVTDASLLTAATDGALLVTVAGKTPKEHLSICAQQLELVGASMLGTVLNRVPRRGHGSAAYGYGSSYYQSKNERYYSKHTSVDQASSQVPEAPAVAVGDEPNAPRRAH